MAGDCSWLHAHARGCSQCREYGCNHRRYDLQRPLQSLLLSHNLPPFRLLGSTLFVERPLYHLERPFVISTKR